MRVSGVERGRMDTLVRFISESELDGSIQGVSKRVFSWDLISRRWEFISWLGQVRLGYRLGLGLGYLLAFTIVQICNFCLRECDMVISSISDSHARLHN